MPFYRCAICQENGSPVAEDITVTLEETEYEGVTRWHGTITATHVTSLVAGQRYRLTLDDGRTGEFLVRRNTFAGDTNRAVSIKGTGALK